MMSSLRKTFTALGLAIAVANFYFTPIANAEQPTNFILALDVSDSMKGEGISAITIAAQSMVEHLPPESKLEVYTFTRTIRLVQPLTSDRRQLISRLNSITSGGATAIYDAISSISSRASALNAPMIVFTDGRDSRSSTDISETIALVKKQHLNINFVSFQLREKERAVLQTIAAAGGGSVSSAEAVDQLVTAFSTALDNATQGVINTDASEPRRTPIALIAGSTGALSFLVFTSLNHMRRRRRYLRRWDDLLDGYEIRQDQRGSTQSTSRLKAGFRSAAMRFIGDAELLFPDPARKRFRQFIIAGGLIVVIVCLTLLGQNLVMATLVAASVVLLIMRWYLKRSESMMLQSFEKDLPNSLKLISASLSTGMSFLQAMETFSQENRSEVARQFRRALSEIQMGVPVERALESVARRMKSKDLEWTVFAYTVQREVGGSLATVLKTTAETIDSRSELRREVRTLSAEGRLSSYILMALPIFIFIFLLAVRPRFISIFWEEQIGHFLLMTVALFLILAWGWMRRLIRIEV